MYILIINNECKGVSPKRKSLVEWTKNNYDGSSLFDFQKNDISKEIKILYRDKTLGYIREVNVL